ncbi:DeoR/GlpR transcriptional regulator [Pseudohoeflea suaedae]|uniref:DeoR/GlpR transcriptional regulator n=1 Tax=Pseudohoeflea suaedae TaxID=877384 RepID=A0A4R5PQB5_9HYPH|nr:DeoR/GlpR family DNA-binding transcription regulator [Pseudohoeflea suaedae]TDH39073.1 DeoR/GlpR transcriptional regulator [Pseudohoeflea suaedae]
MKRESRQQAIMDLLVAEGNVDLDSLAERFSVSRMTIHRDFDELENAGLLRKMRGGATIESGIRFESDFRFRERQGGAAKLAMAREALELVEPGMTVMINDGSMAALLGERLKAKRPLTVITNNAAVIDALKSEAGITLIALGGIYSPKFNAFLGKVTEESLSGLRADIAFISTPAVAGLEVFHMDEQVLRTKRQMMDRARARCLVVNHSRFGHAALYRLGALAEFDHIITDDRPDAETMRLFRENGLPLTLAGKDEAAE